MSTSTDLAVRDSATLAIRPGQTTWDDFQNAALNQLGLKNASNADRAVFLHQCQRTGLDPFAKQIMMIERREKQGNDWVSKWTIQTGIEGWRTIRDRAEKREGLRGILSRFTYYDDEDNEKKVWTRALPPAVVEVTYTVVERGGREVPYTSQLRYSEYVQTREQNGQRVPIAQWLTKPVHMTEKCTEADVYRKTFPQDYAGIELSDAMPAPDPDAPPIRMQSEQVRVSSEQARTRSADRTDWAGAAERGAQKFARTATATAVTPDSSPAPDGSAAPPAPAEGAGEDPTTPGASSSAHAPDSGSQQKTGAPSPNSASGSATIPARKAAMAQDGQVGTIQMHFKRLGYTGSTDDRVSRLSATGKLAGYDGDLLTTNDLSAAQAAQVLLALGKCRDAQALTDLLDAGIAPEATDGE